MNDDNARNKLEKFALRHLNGAPNLNQLVLLIQDRSRPGLPVRGILEEIRHRPRIKLNENEIKFIQELITLYG